MIDQDMMIKAGVVIIAFILGIGSGYWLGNDNQIEEIAEVVLKNETGIDIDLSPSSPEKE